MSSYLLLRNNKESGPFTIEEIQGISLKAYDLVWVVGKSAAWRYPGEIPDLKSFAPPVPEQFTDRFTRKPDTKKSDPEHPVLADPSATNISEPAAIRGRDNNGHAMISGRSIYVNLPADKKFIPKHQDRVLFESGIPAVQQQEPAYDFSDLYKKRSAGASHFSGRILWIGGFLFLFGTGILTGFFISDRRIFFSTAEKSTQKQGVDRAAVPTGNSVISSSGLPSGRQVSPVSNPISAKDSAKIAGLSVVKSTDAPVKRHNKIRNERNDSASKIPALLTTIPVNDSLKQNILPKTDMLFHQIAEHPENYISLQPGHYNTGVFGGISSFPVTVTNNASIKLNLVVSIDYIQNNEKIFKTERLAINDLEPGESVTLKAPKSGRGVKINTHLQVLPNQSDPNPTN